MWRINKHTLQHTFKQTTYNTIRTFANQCQPGQAYTFTTGASVTNLPPARNEPMFNYAPGSAERNELQAELKKQRSAQPLSIPAVIGDEYIYPSSSSPLQRVTMPSDHRHVLATFTESDEKLTDKAIQNSLASKAAWEALPFPAKAAIFLKAADLLSTKYRSKLLAATMLGQGKNAWQAEIDAAAECIDFWRYNIHYAQQIYEIQPKDHSLYTWNRVEYRALEGFLLAVTPFNFTAIGANLASSPAMMGNSVVWKPSNTALLSNFYMYQLMREAGLPAGVINFLPGSGLAVGKQAFAHKDFAGLHFTGSTKTFQNMWKIIGNNIHNYRSYPRIVGETGGKNFHFVHDSADPELVIHQTIRSAFEYSGQKCSACSRLYVPDTLWPRIKQGLVDITNNIINKQMGQPDEMHVFMSAVIDANSFNKIKGYLDQMKKDSGVEIIAGGGYDDSKGYFIQPTIAVVNDPLYVTMREELFGPVLTVYVYPAAKYAETLELCDTTSNYSLTGALFAKDRYALEFANAKLRHSSGNFYINDKSTGAVVGQQPFGGGRGSGTNDKAGAMQNLLRWTSARAIKETLVPISDYQYPHMK